MTELSDIQNGMASLLAASEGGQLVSGFGCPTTDLSTVIAIDAKTGVTLYLSDDVAGLTNCKAKSTYTFTEDGTVTKT